MNNPLNTPERHQSSLSPCSQATSNIAMPTLAYKNPAKRAGEAPGCCQEAGTGPNQTAEIHGEGADKHQADSEGGADPRALVISKSVEAPETCQAEGDHPAGKGDNSCARHYA